MKKNTKNKVKNKVVELPEYTTILTMDNKEYTGKGITILDALLAIPLDYTQIKTKGTIVISQGEKKTEKFFYLKPLKRIFANKLARQLWAINFEKLLNS